MFKFLKNSLNILNCQTIKWIEKRTFLSHAYYCNELWEQRFQDPLIQKVNLDELYNDLDLRYQKIKNVSAVDVDVFAHAVKDESYVDELLDLMHKLRMSADTSNMLNSTPHAVIRNLANFGKTERLLSALDDRLNYGIFLDNFTANLLLDTFWKNKDFLSGARVASQFMLQEDFQHPICASLSLLHCFKYISNPTEWPQPPKPEEPEEEVKIRINYLRNPYDDEHFDLKDPNRIIGKTLMEITKTHEDILSRSFYLLGVALFKPEHVNVVTEKLITNNAKIYKDIFSLIPSENLTKFETNRIQTEPGDLEELLQNLIKTSVNANSERDIATQCKTYSQWDQDRKDALERQRQRLLKMQRLANVEKSQQQLKEKEMLLWFFENEEKIELEIEAKKEQESKQVSTKSLKKRETDEEYVPPEVRKRRSV